MKKYALIFATVLSIFIPFALGLIILIGVIATVLESR
jgi:hypothetical protein